MERKTAADIMAHEVLTVERELPIQQLAEFLIENDISGAPVVDEDGNVLGVVSLTDIAIHEAMPERVAPENPPTNYFRVAQASGLTAGEVMNFRVDDIGGAVTAEEIMTPAVYEVSEDTPIDEVAGVLLSSHIHRVLVTRDKKLMGIITSMDLLRAFVEREKE